MDFDKILDRNVISYDYDYLTTLTCFITVNKRNFAVAKNEVKRMNISEVIKDRINFLGKSQAEIANLIGATPSQFGLFLQGNASLSLEAMNNCFEVLDIDFMLYKRRHDLAKEAAKRLMEKGIDKIGKLHWAEIIRFTGLDELKYYRRYTAKQYQEITNTRCIDIESTQNHMVELINYYLSAFLNSKEHSVDNITSSLSSTTIARVATLKLDSSKKFKPWGAVKMSENKLKRIADIFPFTGVLKLMQTAFLRPLDYPNVKAVLKSLGSDIRVEIDKEDEEHIIFKVVSNVTNLLGTPAAIIAKIAEYYNLNIIKAEEHYYELQGRKAPKKR